MSARVKSLSQRKSIIDVIEAVHYRTSSDKFTISTSEFADEYPDILINELLQHLMTLAQQGAFEFMVDERHSSIWQYRINFKDVQPKMLKRIRTKIEREIRRNQRAAKSPWQAIGRLWRALPKLGKGVVVLVSGCTIIIGGVHPIVSFVHTLWVWLRI